MAHARDLSQPFSELKKLLMALSDVVVNVRKTTWNIFDAKGSVNLYQVANKANLDVIKDITSKINNARTIEDFVEISYQLYAKELAEQTARSSTYASLLYNGMKSFIKSWAGYPDKVIEKYVYAVRFIIISRLSQDGSLKSKIDGIIGELRARKQDLSTLIPNTTDKAALEQYKSESVTVEQKWLALLQVQEKEKSGKPEAYPSNIFFNEIIKVHDDRGLNEKQFEDFEVNVKAERRLLTTIDGILKAYQDQQEAEEKLKQDAKTTVSSVSEPAETLGSEARAIVIEPDSSVPPMEVVCVEESPVDLEAMFFSDATLDGQLAPFMARLSEVRVDTADEEKGIKFIEPNFEPDFPPLPSLPEPSSAEKKSAPKKETKQDKDQQKEEVLELTHKSTTTPAFSIRPVDRRVGKPPYSGVGSAASMFPKPASTATSIKAGTDSSQRGKRDTHSTRSDDFMYEAGSSAATSTAASSTATTRRGRNRKR